MDEPTREVQDVAGFEERLVARAVGCTGLDRSTVLRPGLIVKRIRVHWVVNDPALRAGDLQHEHVVDVVVRGEPPRLLRRDVRVDLHGMPELAAQRPGEGHERWPEPVQRLQDERVPGYEQIEDSFVANLIADRRSD